ncbi:hypothetical protein CTAM01_11979 [Colletotrichum tamarilloi]|uniref:Uncharacterized protein n=1 Tax=Colletotrichum tamarilloi TaxID=1209934 RepID=A0ABQ9QW52_9PEZI|nr:uncharacterized protein CTAM01_11979 [Colletotrichum tamarilloi]KAK1487046.1 hypothetical protein CTAM01_11979 [Colletotrichum tamarilloi]
MKARFLVLESRWRRICGTGPAALGDLPSSWETLGNSWPSVSKGVQCHTTNETKASEQVKQKPKESSREIVRGKQLALSAGVLTV